MTGEGYAENLFDVLICLLDLVVGLGIVSTRVVAIPDFFGIVIFNYVGLGIRMCVSPGIAIFNYAGSEIRKHPRTLPLGQ